MHGFDQPTWTIGVREVGARARLRLIVGMRLLESLARDSNCVARRLPSIRAVAAASGSHRNTVAAAYADLVSFGLIRCDVGSGTFASCPRLVHADSHDISLLCRELELARLLAAEIGRTSIPGLSAGELSTTGSILLHPLDQVPTTDVTPYPIAPSGETFTVLRSLRRGSTAVVVSQSPSARRLMRSAIHSLHGASVGVVSFEPDAASPDSIARISGDAPAVLFHDADWSHGCRGIICCSLQFLLPEMKNSMPAGTHDWRRSCG